MVTNRCFRMRNGRTVAYEQQMPGMNAYYDKHWVLPEGIHAEPIEYHLYPALAGGRAGRTAQSSSIIVVCKCRADEHDVIELKAERATALIHHKPRSALPKEGWRKGSRSSHICKRRLCKEEKRFNRMTLTPNLQSQPRLQRQLFCLHHAAIWITGAGSFCLCCLVYRI